MIKNAEGILAGPAAAGATHRRRCVTGTRKGKASGDLSVVATVSVMIMTEMPLRQVMRVAMAQMMVFVPVVVIKTSCLCWYRKCENN
jgi:hypothetical protein